MDMKRLIRASYNGDKGKYFGDLPIEERHNGKKQWRLRDPYLGEIVVWWRSNHYKATIIKPIYHRTKGYETGFTYRDFWVSDQDIKDSIVLAEI